MQTIIPHLTRKVNLSYQRERIFTPDNDFLDLDWSVITSKKLTLILHGLEGAADRPYVKGLSTAFNSNGYDTVAMNFRGCSGEPNKLYRMYHSGETNDLDLVIKHILSNYDYDEVNLVGVSVGGNMVLKYLGEKNAKVPSIIRKAAALSAPCDLVACSNNFLAPSTKIYLNRFMESLKLKLIAKAVHFPDRVDTVRVKQMKNFQEFDEYYTAPANGFSNAAEYYYQASAIRVIEKITLPTLLINAQNDPFLTPECFPIDIARDHDLFYLETPKHGGHVGFFTIGNQYWTEKRIVEFIDS